MQSIIYTNEKGQSIKLTNTKPFFLQTIEGTGAVNTDVQMQKAPFQDGETHIDTLLESRYLTLEVVILSKNQNQLYEYRQQLSKTFNPKIKGFIKYINNNTEKILSVVVEKAPVWGKTRPNVQPCIISLIAPSPFWLDTFIEGEELSYLMGGIKFGLRLPTTFSYRGKKKKIVNSGDVSTPVKIEFYGPGSNPTIHNETTGELIKVKKELLEGEILKIDTTFGNKKVEIERLNGSIENAFGYIELDSVFWSLVPGENILSYESLNDSQKTKVKVTYRNRYTGV
ncbi:phage tail family protein [Maledivibacter halophilus]|uniref:Phage tail protein n=1 Tax=Maledivibacter halophilus TaxID=36842 RepID=A0A1T5KFU3_9FIRM|nr:phage tail family protein [Maledivibacter halophilus]SKC62564.1 Phage tail protein [Maledivibacter halophilus]